MKVSKTKLDQAGVMRCCIEGLHSFPPDADVEPGQHIVCPYGETCDGLTLTEDGVWVAAWRIEQEKGDG